jgi:ABC-type dipeptide/oligopeptide/nickel transport system permease subunit
MTVELVNSLGLVSNIVGVVIVFFFGFPQPSHEDGNTLTWGTNPKAKYQHWSKTGLILMILGFGFQLIATWLPKIL